MTLPRDPAPLTPSDAFAAWLKERDALEAQVARAERHEDALRRAVCGAAEWLIDSERSVALEHLRALVGELRAAEVATRHALDAAALSRLSPPAFTRGEDK